MGSGVDRSKLPIGGAGSPSSSASSLPGGMVNAAAPPSPLERRIEAAFRTAYKHADATHPVFGRASIGYRAWWQSVVTHTFTLAGVHADTQQVSSSQQQQQLPLPELSDRLVRLFATKEPFTLRPGVHDALSRLAALSPRPVLGVLSNSDPRTRDVIDELGLAGMFDFVMLSYNLGLEKPDPRVFAAAIEAASGVLTRRGQPGTIAAERAVHVGDSLERDVMAAQAAGWIGFKVQYYGDGDDDGGGDKTGLSRPTVESNLDELVRLVEKRGRGE
ncbi:HAD-like domain-containing protein [Zopfochytrium polystomum]|nr:HAD-like domain-containing protein [Zopfochytrium polystomum]